jgi:hypothetical protein
MLGLVLASGFSHSSCGFVVGIDDLAIEQGFCLPMRNASSPCGSR